MQQNKKKRCRPLFYRFLPLNFNDDVQTVMTFNSKFVHTVIDDIFFIVEQH